MHKKILCDPLLCDICLVSRLQPQAASMEARVNDLNPRNGNAKENLNCYYCAIFAWFLAYSLKRPP